MSATDDWRQWPEGRKRAFLERLRLRAAAWEGVARAAQRPPPGDWYIWALVGGRGSGKTRAGVEWLASEVATDGSGDESAIVAPTFADARDTCVEGPSGVLAALERRGVAVSTWNRSLGELRLRSGAVVRIDGADDGGLRLQGHNFRRALCDELGLWREGAGERAWEESLLPAVRLGEPRIVVATTPKPTPLMRRLLRDPEAHITRMTTFDNADNLAPAFLEQMRSRYEGTRLGRQELWGELLEDVEGALWRRAWIDDHRVTAPPPTGFTQVVVGLDPADGTANGAEQALVVAGFGLDRQFYVLHSEGVRATPLRWLMRAVTVAREHEAKRLVLEKNFGGRALIDVLEQAFDRLGTRVAHRVVSATTAKLTRAEPVAALYEQGRVSHVGHHRELEEQLVSFTGASGERSPDRLDAATWAITDLMGYGLRREPVDLANTVVPYSDHISHPTVVAWR